MKLTNENYVDEAEKVIVELCKKTDKYGNPDLVSTSKIRKILSMVTGIYNDARHMIGDSLDSDMRGRLQYLKMHIVYEAGRDNKEGPVRRFIDKAELVSLIDSVSNKKDLIIFCHYMEALVAYQRYHGGKN